MSSATVMFIVPEAQAGLAAAAAEEFGGRFEDLPEGGDLGEFLADRRGTPVTVVFEDSDDPLDEIDALLKALKIAGTPYFAVTGSYTERSRGIRVEGRVILNLDGTILGETRHSYPWVEGEPEMNERCMLIAGYTLSECEAMASKFFPDIPAPRY